MITPTLSQIEATIIGMTKQEANEYEIFHTIYEDLDKVAPDKDMKWIVEIMDKAKIKTS